ncbi:hypothetical protein [Gemmatimonas sp.]
MPASGMTKAKQALAQLQREADQRRDRAAAARGLSSVADSYVAAVVPQHRARLRPLAAVRRRAFVARLRELVAFVRRTSADADERTMDNPAPLDAVSTAVVVATCSACRGKCCGNGGNHAFLRTRTMREFIAVNASLTDDAIVDAYVSYLPARSMHPGCVYQGHHGCTLPRTMRSAICNAYVCGGLQHVLDESAARTVRGEVTRGVYVASRDARTLRGGRLRELPVLSSD